MSQQKPLDKFIKDNDALEVVASSTIKLPTFPDLAVVFWVDSRGHEEKIEQARSAYKAAISNGNVSGADSHPGNSFSFGVFTWGALLPKEKADYVPDSQAILLTADFRREHAGFLQIIFELPFSTMALEA